MILIYDGTPSGTTTPGGAGSTATSSTGLWDATTLGQQGRWIDVAGGVYEVSGGNFVGLNAGGGVAGNNLAIRPANEDSIAQAITVYLPVSVTGNLGIVTRYQRSGSSAGSYYYANWAYGLNLFTVACYLAGSGLTTIQNLAPSAAYNAVHTYSASLTATTSGSTTTLAVVLIDLTASSTILSQSVTDTTTALQGAGATGVSSWGGTTQFSRVQASASSAPITTPPWNFPDAAMSSFLDMGF